MILKETILNVASPSTFGSPGTRQSRSSASWSSRIPAHSGTRWWWSMTVPTSGPTVDAATVAHAAPSSGQSQNMRPSSHSLRWSGVTAPAHPDRVILLVIHRYGVNGIYTTSGMTSSDHTRYTLVPYFGHTTIGTLWAQHDENHTFFPNLIVLALGAVTHFEHRDRAIPQGSSARDRPHADHPGPPAGRGPTRLIFYLPLAFLIFILGQFEKTLFGYQISWYLVIASSGRNTVILNLPRMSWLVLVGAIAMAVVGSYSGTTGLLSGQRASLSYFGSAALGRCLEMAHFSRSNDGFVILPLSSLPQGRLRGAIIYVLAHPLTVAEFFFFFAIGDLMGRPFPQDLQPQTRKLSRLELPSFFSPWSASTITGRRRSLSRNPIGSALICFGVPFAILVTIGRTYVGIWAASSTLCMEDLLILVGCYLCLLELACSRSRVANGRSRGHRQRFRNDDQLGRIFPHEWRQGLVVAAPPCRDGPHCRGGPGRHCEWPSGRCTRASEGRV